VIRGGWRARGDVTSDFVTARVGSVGWPKARSGPCEARRLVRALNRARVAMHGFQSGRRFFMASCGDKGRECPSLQWADSKAENARAFDVGNKESRTPVLFTDSDQDSCSREHPC